MSTALGLHQGKELSSRKELCLALCPAELRTSELRAPQGKLCHRATRCTNRQQVLGSPCILQTEHELQMQSSMRANHCTCSHSTPPHQPSAMPLTLPSLRDQPYLSLLYFPITEGKPQGKKKRFTSQGTLVPKSTLESGPIIQPKALPLSQGEEFWMLKLH